MLERYGVEWALRGTLGIIYLYTGLDLIRHPSGWYWAVRQLPLFLQNLITSTVGLDRFLFMQGVSELVIACLLLLWFLPRWTLKVAAAVVTIEMGMILLLVGFRGDTFRDLGLLGEGLALLILTFTTPRR